MSLPGPAAGSALAAGGAVDAAGPVDDGAAVTGEGAATGPAGPGTSPPATRPPTTAATAPALATWPALSAAATNGSWASQVSGPSTHSTRPSEMPTNARTTSGSNCVPAHRISSARAAPADRTVL